MLSMILKLNVTKTIDKCSRIAVKLNVMKTKIFGNLRVLHQNIIKQAFQIQTLTLHKFYLNKTREKQIAMYRNM